MSNLSEEERKVESALEVVRMITGCLFGAFFVWATFKGCSAMERIRAENAERQYQQDVERIARIIKASIEQQCREQRAREAWQKKLQQEQQQKTE